MKFVTQAVKSYFAILLITLCGSLASLAIIDVAQKQTFLTYGTEGALALELEK